MLKRDHQGYERVHDLLRSVDGQHYCTQCQLSWQRQPKTYCAGVPVYQYGVWPEDLHTRTQLRRRKYWPRDLEQPDGAYFLRKSPYRRWLYRLSDAKPWRVPTPAQQEAIAKMRAGLVLAYTCGQCGYYDPSHGKQKRARRFDRGWCLLCWDHHADLVRQAEQCRWAHDYLQQGEFLVLDSETTGLDFQQDEVIELSIVTGSGAILFNSLIQPEDPKRYDLATHIHRIDRERLQMASRFPQVWPQIEQILRQHRRVLVYNAFFDRSMLESTARRYGYTLPPAEWECLMEAFARYAGGWSAYHGGYPYASLNWACWRMKVKHNGPGHRALADTQRALGVLQVMVAQHGTIDVLESSPETEDVFIGEDLGDLAGHPF